ncbi:MAG TPA: DAK2 domain-containing protein, partial [Candidatus Limnocylindrales bacterium]|nr:DAK2 domain-containing protein [Candidatus Limnocylindrales bacterium]
MARARRPRARCTTAGLLDAIRSAVANLEAHVDEINSLNVFPVPDGDTGTNMVATVRAALEEAESTGRNAPVDRMAAAVGLGALMGARGNSGVITSQILRGFAEGLAGKREFSGLDLANALAIGAKTAYAAVGKPVEGTILTVIREAAAAAVEAAERDDAVATVLAATVDGARRSVARTPSLLRILREAGVVDSGGQGLFRLFEGALLAVEGRPVRSVAGTQVAVAESVAGTAAPARRGEERRAVAPAFRSGVASLEADAYGYETVFVLAPLPDATLDVQAIQQRLEEIGNSVLVGGDERLVKVHVHNERPDEVIGYGLSLGTLTRITVENLDSMADDVREARASSFVGGAEPSPSRGDASAGDAGTGRVAAATPAVSPGTRDLDVPDLAQTATNGEHRARATQDRKDRTPTGSDGGQDGGVINVDPALGPAIVAVVAGDGLEKLFRDFGVELIVRGGQSANPSTGELLRIARLARAREVIVLPNNPNVRLAAEQAARICAERRLVVVPTRNAAEGIAALLAFDADADAAANVEPMTAAGRGLATIQVTEAVRDAKIGGRRVKKGQTIVLDPDDGLVAADGDRDRAVLKAVGSFRAGVELVTLYYGDDASLLEAEGIARKIGERLGAEVEVV